jgi:hypothetical protein
MGFEETRYCVVYNISKIVTAGTNGNIEDMRILKSMYKVRLDGRRCPGTPRNEI